ncbi:hypothetical protein TNCV_5102151 [Trichonephila clavipes]|nr:hypothetical protein TNCV_5102151 [Trichonephila clavipes]
MKEETNGGFRVKGNNNSFCTSEASVSTQSSRASSVIACHSSAIALLKKRHRTHLCPRDLENALAILYVEYPRCPDNLEQRMFDDMLRCRP